MTTTAAARTTFHGWRVVAAASVLAMYGWGLGFYGPPVFLKVLHEQHNWPIALISAAITVHFLVGSAVGANIPALYSRFGATNVTRSCTLAMAAGLLGWANADQPWQMFVAGVLSGAGWGGMSAAAINAIVSPWFVRRRPSALGMAYNGGSIGGVIFSPLWVAAIAEFGFPSAALLIGAVMVGTVWVLSQRYFAQTPGQLGISPDGDALGLPDASVTSPQARPLPGPMLWRDRRFVTLSIAMALGLFAQIGLMSHLYSLLAPILGAQMAGFAMASITAMAIAGRTVLGLAMPTRADRRVVACAGYAAQLLGSIAFCFADGNSIGLLLAGVVLFGLGFGNATSLPPLVVQVEFVKEDVARAVALVVGLSQAVYAFAPVTFGLIREFAPSLGASRPTATPFMFAVAALLQALAITAFLAGRRSMTPAV